MAVGAPLAAPDVLPHLMTVGAAPCGRPGFGGCDGGMFWVLGEGGERRGTVSSYI